MIKRDTALPFTVYDFPVEDLEFLNFSIAEMAHVQRRPLWSLLPAFTASSNTMWILENIPISEPLLGTSL